MIVRSFDCMTHSKSTACPDPCDPASATKGKIAHGPVKVPSMSPPCVLATTCSEVPVQVNVFCWPVPDRVSFPILRVTPSRLLGMALSVYANLGAGEPAG